MLTKKEATDRALAAGATMVDIAEEASKQARHVGSTPFKCMILALNMMTWRNTRDDWTRLAGAMTAKANARKRA